MEKFRQKNGRKQLKNKLNYMFVKKKKINTPLGIEEDLVWETLAQTRDKKGALFVSHKQAWD